MPLSKQQFALLVRNAPEGTSEEEILAKAKEAESNPSLLASIWHAVSAPLTTLPSQVANKAADAMDQRSLSESPTLARVKGFAAGATQGAGKVLTDMTSPLSIALMLSGLGGEKAAAEALPAAKGVSSALDTVPGALADVPAVQPMAGNVPPEFHAVLDTPAGVKPGLNTQTPVATRPMSMSDVQRLKDQGMTNDQIRALLNKRKAA